jgi:hypothetical protein
VPVTYTLAAVRVLRLLPVALAAVAAAACVDRSMLIKSANEVSVEFCRQYEQILHERGMRSYPRRRDDAVYRLRTAAQSLGMRIESYDLELGYVRFVGPAPLPLNLREWASVAEQDLPLMRKIVAENAGWMTQWLIPFEPEGLDTVINATAVATSRGSEIRMSMRLREVRPPPSGFPRRECPPPTAVRRGLDKIWAAVDVAMEVRPASR